LYKKSCFLQVFKICFLSYILNSLIFNQKVLAAKKADMRNQTTKRSIKHCSGSTLISSLVAVTILLIALLGTSSLRYHASLDGRKAAAQTTAARIAQVVCESWRGWQGDLTYDPVSHLGSNLTVSTLTTGPSVPSGFTLQGKYKIIPDLNENDTNGSDYYLTLSYKDIQSGLRALNVVISWAQKGATGYENVDKTFTLTTYAITS
jgi:hypothetical protein